MTARQDHIKSRKFRAGPRAGQDRAASVVFSLFQQLSSAYGGVGGGSGRLVGLPNLYQKSKVGTPRRRWPVSAADASTAAGGVVRVEAPVPARSVATRAATAARLPLFRVRDRDLSRTCVLPPLPCHDRHRRRRAHPGRARPQLHGGPAGSCGRRRPVRPRPDRPRRRCPRARPGRGREPGRIALGAPVSLELAPVADAAGQPDGQLVGYRFRVDQEMTT